MTIVVLESDFGNVTTGDKHKVFTLNASDGQITKAFRTQAGVKYVYSDGTNTILEGNYTDHEIASELVHMKACIGLAKKLLEID